MTRYPRFGPTAWKGECQLSVDLTFEPHRLYGVKYIGPAPIGPSQAIMRQAHIILRYLIWLMRPMFCMGLNI